MGKRGILGKPKYKMGDRVSFPCRGEFYKGEIFIVDDYGTSFQSKEPSYDIMVTDELFNGLYKHIPESLVIGLSD